MENKIFDDVDQLVDDLEIKLWDAKRFDLAVPDHVYGLLTLARAVQSLNPK